MTRCLWMGREARRNLQLMAGSLAQYHYWWPNFGRQLRTKINTQKNEPY